MLRLIRWNSKFRRSSQINLQENLLKSALVSISKRNIRSLVPEHLHPTYIHSSQNMEMLREPMGLDNKHLGYVYLVDENVKIRWAGCGFPIEDEKVALFDCTRQLLDRWSETTGEQLGVVEEGQAKAVKEEITRMGFLPRPKPVQSLAPPTPVVLAGGLRASGKSGKK